VYIPEELKRRIEETARREERSEAEVIRCARCLYRRTMRKPRLGFLVDGPENDASRDEELLAQGFGED